MGSRPWKNALFNRLSPDREDEEFTLELPNGAEVQGRYVGWGTKGNRQFMILSTAPEGMGVRDNGYWDYQEWIEVVRDLKIDGVPAPEFGRAA